MFHGTLIGSTQRPQSSSFLGLPYRILNMNPQKELLWGLWVGYRGLGSRAFRFQVLGLGLHGFMVLGLGCGVWGLTFRPVGFRV